jgi:hypothetical protein
MYEEEGGDQTVLEVFVKPKIICFFVYSLEKKFAVPRSEISFIPRTKRKYICLPGLEKDNLRSHTPKSVCDPKQEFSGYTR